MPTDSPSPRVCVFLVNGTAVAVSTQDHILGVIDHMDAEYGRGNYTTNFTTLNPA